TRTALFHKDVFQNGKSCRVIAAVFERAVAAGVRMALHDRPTPSTSSQSTTTSLPSVSTPVVPTGTSSSATTVTSLRSVSEVVLYS
ncbi:hypothetical protein DPEC_G00061980, partial [Dallia pectoralis]